MQPVQNTSRREALGLLVTLPLLAAGRSAQAADLADSRQHKGDRELQGRLSLVADGPLLSACCPSVIYGLSRKHAAASPPYTG